MKMKLFVLLNILLFAACNNHPDNGFTDAEQLRFYREILKGNDSLNKSIASLVGNDFTKLGEDSIDHVQLNYLLANDPFLNIKKGEAFYSDLDFDVNTHYPVFTSAMQTLLQQIPTARLIRKEYGVGIPFNSAKNDEVQTIFLTFKKQDVPSFNLNFQYVFSNTDEPKYKEDCLIALYLDTLYYYKRNRAIEATMRQLLHAAYSKR